MRAARDSDAPASWVAVSLPAAGGTLFANVFGINDAGVVVGDVAPTYSQGGPDRRAFQASTSGVIDVWFGGMRSARGMNTSGQIIGIGPHGKAAYYANGALVLEDPLASFNAINEAGVIAGCTGGLPTLWSSSGATTLALPGGATTGCLYDVGNDGTAVGNVWNPTLGLSMPAVWRAGTPTVLHEGSGLARAINASGQILGSLVDGGVSRLGFWQSGTFREIPLVPGPNGTVAVDINDAGIIVGVGGYSSVPRISGATTIWVDREPLVLPQPADAWRVSGVAINNAGQAAAAVERIWNGSWEVIIWDLKAAVLEALATTLDNAVEQGGVTNAGITTALTSKLAGASDALTRGNTTAAANQLEAFQQHVSAQTGKHIIEKAAAELTRVARIASAVISR